MIERKSVLLRLDPAMHEALVRWAADELRSTNAQIEFLLCHALADAGRTPSRAGRMGKPGRPQAAGAPSPCGWTRAAPPPTSSRILKTRQSGARSGFPC
jgi:hypothetical protein